jgi:hypothetical protein
LSSISEKIRHKWKALAKMWFWRSISLRSRKRNENVWQQVETGYRRKRTILGLMFHLYYWN